MINLLFLLGDVLERGFVGIILTLDTLIYGLVSSAFKVFMAIASARLLSSDAYYTIANKVYLIIGVLMLFVLAYAMLKAIVNPDEGKKSFGPGIIKRIVIAVVGLAIAPALFNLMYQVQGLVLEHNVLGRLFFRSDNTATISPGTVTVGGQQVTLPDSNPDDYINVVGGSVTATTIWQAFFYPAEDSGKSAEDIVGDLSDYYLSTAGGWGVVCAIAGYAAYAGYSAAGTGYGLLVGLLGTAVAAFSCTESVSNLGSAISHSGEKITLAEAYTSTAQGDPFGIYTVFIDSYLEDGEISYLYGVSTIAGAFTLYAFVSFSIDMGVRAAKLAYYQIIAPVPLIMQVLPGKGEATFKEYTKSVLNTFLEVFIRIAVVYIVVYIICHLQTLFSSVDALWGNQNLSTPEVMLAMAFLIIGLIIFCKEAPKFLSKTLGIDGGNLHLGIGKKLADGGAYTAASAIGGGVTAGVNNLTNTVNRWRNPKTWQNKDGNYTPASVFGNLVRGVASPFVGAASGAVRGGVAGKDAKHVKDVQRGAATGAQGAIRARENRESYADSHNDGLLIGGNSVMAGHIQDMGKGVLRWAGFNSLDSLQQEEKALSALKAAKSKLGDAATSVIEGDVAKRKSFTYGVTVNFDLADYNRKNGTSFTNTSTGIPGLDGRFSTDTLIALRDAISRAEHASDGRYLGVTADAWKALTNKYQSEFADELQNVALMRDEDFDAARIAAGSSFGTIGSVRNAATDFRVALEDNIGGAVIGNANLAAGTGHQQLSVELVRSGSIIVNNDSAVSKLKNAIDDEETRLHREKAKIRQREEGSGGGGGGKK